MSDRLSDAREPRRPAGGRPRSLPLTLVDHPAAIIPRAGAGGVGERPAAAPHPVVQVRPAATGDLAGIIQLVNEYARRGDLLPRPPEAIARTLADWVVGVDTTGQVLGCGSLLIYTAQLAEVRSLAVAPAAQGIGLGRAVVEALVTEAGRRNIPTLFALTRAVPFFQRLGFHITEKDRFPQKIWQDCVLCPLRENCDETAVVRELTPVTA